MQPNRFAEGDELHRSLFQYPDRLQSGPERLESHCLPDFLLKRGIAIQGNLFWQTIPSQGQCQGL